jgi:ABC-type Fe3+-hydroxamate transport system substrate-binding protein
MSPETGQPGDGIELSACPQRIISVVPSITELLHDLDLEEEVVAITKFCVHPQHWFRQKTRVGGTKKLLTDRIAALHPDLIIANKEENTKQDVQILKQFSTVWITDVKTLDDALLMIARVGKLCCRDAAANRLIQEITSAFHQLRQHPCFSLPPVSAAYLIWRDPYMIAGTDTFINNMMTYCNLKNAFQDTVRYPVVDLAALKASEASLILLSSEPFPFKDQHMNELKDALPGKTIMLVDGEMFSWYGSRLIKAAVYFNQLLQVIQQHNLPTQGE